VETKKEKEIMGRKKWDNWRETKTGLFVFLFFSNNLFSLAWTSGTNRNGSANPGQFCTKIFK
jgi:hypothetical protein